MNKTCSRCHDVKPLAAFKRDRRNPDGFAGFCKACYNERSNAQLTARRHNDSEYRQRHVENNREYRNRVRGGPPPKGLFIGTDSRECAMCHEIKPMAEFARSRAAFRGRLAYCRPCSNQRSKTRDWSRSAPPDPLKERTRARTRAAVRAGKMHKPECCQRCGEKPRERRLLHAHHTDYANPLEVRWLCSLCHALEHHPETPPRAALARPSEKPDQSPASGSAEP